MKLPESRLNALSVPTLFNLDRQHFDLLRLPTFFWERAALSPGKSIDIGPGLATIARTFAWADRHVPHAAEEGVKQKQ
jgi:hypothetical protein